jgi:small-conductance mechanosensitive channel
MELLIPFKLQIIETIIVIIAAVVLKLFSRKAINKIFINWELDLQRKRLSQRIVNVFLILIVLLIITGIWNIHQDQLMVFVTSVITILGIAFFAQWSIISNITASLILFFNHPLRIGEEIEILDKEYAVKGRLEDISFFFMMIRSENGELITVPNNLALQKIILTKNKA